jgi:hypothetical protein
VNYETRDGGLRFTDGVVTFDGEVGLGTANICYTHTTIERKTSPYPTQPDSLTVDIHLEARISPAEMTELDVALSVGPNAEDDE